MEREETSRLELQVVKIAFSFAQAIRRVKVLIHTC